MSGETTNSIAMDTAAHLPIAQLTPLLNAPASRCIKAVVSLTWPYSSATGAIAFLLSEPDFRLRRVRGQVRVQFAGSSAKSVAKAGIASGDEITLCLDGVEWIENQDSVATPGRGVEFELKFTERLHLQFKQEDALDFTTIDIDHPAPEHEVLPILARPPTPEPSPPPITNGTSVKHGISSEVVNEWSSPAFLKRARTSYGSLFDSDYDPFTEEDGTRHGKGRKRTRLSSTWIYSSRSPTPEVQEVMKEVDSEPLPKPPPTMTDEACQTDGLETGAAAETLADFARQATNIGGSSYSQLLNGSHPSEDITPTGLDEEVEAPTMPPPKIQMQPPNLGSDQTTDFHRETPSSPRLNPIPSDSLPLVSPLLSHNYGFDFGRPIQVTQDTTTEDQPAVPNGTADVDNDEDIYGASPVRRRSNFSTHEFNGFQEPPGGGESADFPAVAGPVAIEHQYGNWQSTNAQYSHSASPSKEDDYDYEGPQMGHSYESEEQDQSEDGLSGSHGHTSQYPEIDPELTGSVQYPELSNQTKEMDDEDHEDDAGDENIASPLLPRAPAMSRSQSAQSPIVDLTENSDDEEEQDPQNEDGGSMRGSDLEGDFEEEEEEEEAIMKFQIPDGVQRGRYVQRGYEGDSGESVESDADAEGEEDLAEDNGHSIRNNAEQDLQQNNRNRQTYDDDEDEEGSFDEEESYDEDEMEEEDAPRGDRIVIDLLSSDDENADEASPTVASAPQISRSQFQRNPAESADESEGSNEEEDIDDENDIPYAEREEIRTHIPRASRLLQADQEDDAMYEADGDEESLNGQDDASQLGVETHDPQVAQRAYSLSSGSEDEAEEDEKSEGSGSDEDEEQDSRDIDGLKTPDDAEELQAIKDDILERSESVELAENDEQSAGRTPPLSSVLNLDGADDERSPTRVSYPDLPDEPSPPTSINGKSHSLEQFEPPRQYANAQLPTPDTSQPAETVIVTESSFTSTIMEVTSETPTSILNEEYRTLLVESSTEIQRKEVITQVSSVHLNLSSSGDGQMPADIVETDAAKDDLPATDDVVMGEATIEKSENFDETITSESSDPSLIEANENSLLDQSADNEGGVLEPVTESGSDLKASDSQEHILQRESSPMEEVAEADEDATAVESNNTDEPSDISDVQFTEQQGVTTRSAAQALAKAGTVDDEGLAQRGPVLEHVQEQQKHDDVVAEEPEFTLEHPRRSHRRIKSTTSAAKGEDNARPVTPVKSHAASQLDKSVNDRRSPMVVIDSHSAPKGHDASFELALSSLDSPSKPPHDLRKPPVADLKLRLSRALRTELSEFTALKVLRYHMNQKLDILAIATTTPPEPQRAKGGPRHYQITFNITDPSIAPSGVTEVQVFRPYSHALPTISAGDGILLRNFQVSSVQKGFALRSTQEEGSSWAVFKDSEEPEIRGPPVEYGNGEKSHILALKTWFAGLDDVAKAKINRANGDKAAARR